MEFQNNDCSHTGFLNTLTSAIYGVDSVLVCWSGCSNKQSKVFAYFWGGVIIHIKLGWFLTSRHFH